MEKLKQKMNVVIIEGILSELEVKEADKDGKNYIVINATFKIEHPNETELDEKGKEIPVPDDEVTTNTFSYQVRNDNQPNKIYKSLKTIQEQYESIAAVGYDKATRVKLNSAELQSGVFFAQGDGKKIDTFKIRNTFFARQTDKDVPHRAEFKVDVFIIDVNEEEDWKGNLTGNLEVIGAIAKYNGDIEVMKFIATHPDAKTFIKQYYKPGVTVNLQGQVCSKKIETVTETSVGFGTAVKNKSVRTDKKLLISAGTLPLEDGWNKDAMREALGRYNQKLEQDKATAIAKGGSSSSSTTSTKKSGYDF